MKTAVMLSFGMLNREVDTNKFITPLLEKVTAQNPGFVLNQQVLNAASVLAAKFNKQEIESEQFKKDILKLFALTIEDTEFWNLWNAMVTIGDEIKAKLDELKAFSKTEDALICFYSDTNIVHLQFIQAQLQANDIALDLQSELVQLEGFSLYPSCQFGKEKFDLIQLVKTKIAEDNQKNKRSEKILLILGDPKNIEHSAYQAKIAQETQMIQEWAQANNVAVTLHAKSHLLLATLYDAIQLVHANQQSTPTFNA